MMRQKKGSSGLRWLFKAGQQGLILLASGLTISSSFATATVFNPLQTARQPEIISQETTNGKIQRLLQEGLVLMKRNTPESLQEAVSKFEEALRLSQMTVRNKKSEANLLIVLGSIRKELGETKLALENLKQALLLLRELDNFRERESTIVMALLTVGEIYIDLKKGKQALEYLSQALPLVRELNDTSGEANVLAAMGYAYNILGEKQQALNDLKQALSLLQTENDRSSKANILKTIGEIQVELREYEQALEYLRQSLLIFQKLNDDREQVYILVSIAQIHFDLGEIAKSLEYFKQALPISQKLDNPQIELQLVTGIVRGYISNLDSGEQALEYFEQALLLAQKLNNPKEEISLLELIGGFYASLGSNKGLEYFDKASLIAQKLSDCRERARVFLRTGLTHLQFDDRQKALTYLNQALKLTHTLKVDREDIDFLQQLAGIYYGLGEKKKALEQLKRGLQLVQNLHSRNEVNAYSLSLIYGFLGLIYAELSDFEMARKYLNQAMPLLQKYENRNLSTVFIALAITNFANGRDPLRALKQIDEAIRIYEQKRIKLRSQELRVSYFEFNNVQEFYEIKIDASMILYKLNNQDSYAKAALETSDRSRARSLIELLTESRADIRKGISKSLRDQEIDLQQRLNAREAELSRLFTVKGAEAQIPKVQAQLAALRQEQQDLVDKIRRESPEYAKLQYPEPLTFAQMQQQLDDDTLLLQYSLGEEHSYLWVVSKTGMTSYTLPKRSEIEQAADSFLSAVSSPGSPNDVQDPGQRLSQAIKLDAIMPLVQGKKLLIVADGTLHRIPFAALPNPNAPNTYQPLILDHEIINLPSISAIAALRQTPSRNSAPKTLAVLADPVFTKTDDRVTGKEHPIPCSQIPYRTASTNPLDSPLTLQLQQSRLERTTRALGLDNIQRLPNTRREAERILATVPPEQRIALCDFDANRQWVNQPNALAQYRYVLFSTHGLINTVNPEESSIVLSLVDQRGEPRSGLLRLGDIFNLNLNAELVVLSACETGRGKEVRGEGIVGFTRGFMYAGAKRVVVSLWSVNDGKTADLMASFYQQVIQDHRSPATALQLAQKQFWQAQQGTEYQHPYYWAAFTLQGEWRK